MVIPIWFTDSGNYIASSNKENVRSDIQTAYFGTNEATGWRSVKTFYEEESHGALTFTGTVSEWYSCGKSSSQYYTDANATVSLVKTASDWYFNNHSSTDKRKNYDKDGDGYIDSVMLIYAAPDYAAAGTDNNNLWAYCYWVGNTSVKNARNPGANVFFWASYDFRYNSSKAQERTGKTNYGGGDTSHCNLDTHTYIHEMGHVFGLEDYYDYSGQYNPAGGFSMQDNNVGGHDPYSSYALGWGKAYIPTETTTIDLKPFAETGEMILLDPTPNTKNSPFDEYLLLEYYTPTGLNKFDSDNQYHEGYQYPKGPKDSGIRVWHVDARLAQYSGSYYGGSFSLTTQPPSEDNRVKMAMSNTYYKSGVSTGYLSPLGSEDSKYYNFNILQLIRKNRYTTYKPTNDFSSNDLYRAGGTFDVDRVKGQFVNSGKFNDNTDIGFTFTINALDQNRASITVTKL